MKKNFDCVEFQRESREKLWKESGETVEGFFKLIDEKTKSDELWIKLTKRKLDTENKLKTS